MIKYVRLTGVIVAMDEFPGRIVYILDDSSGANIEVTCAAPSKPSLTEEGSSGGLEAATSNNNPVLKQAPVQSASAEPQELISPDGPNLTNVEVGSVVKIKGGIGVFRDQKQIRLKVITIIGDTNAEVKCWNDVAKFKRDVLSQPWVVSPEDEEKCRLEVDREARWKMEEEAKRKKEELRRHLGEKNRELREKHRQTREAQENLRNNDKSREKHQKAKPEQENTRDINDGAKKRKVRDRRNEGLDAENRVNYPSKAARRRAAGKYDALGI
jgi:hypothetical protein